MVGGKGKGAIITAAFLGKLSTQSDLLQQLRLVAAVPSQSIGPAQQAQLLQRKTGAKLSVGCNRPQLPFPVRMVDGMGRDTVVTDQVTDPFPQLLLFHSAAQPQLLPEKLPCHFSPGQRVIGRFPATVLPSGVGDLAQIMEQCCQKDCYSVFFRKDPEALQLYQFLADQSGMGPHIPFPVIDRVLQGF